MVLWLCYYMSKLIILISDYIEITGIQISDLATYQYDDSSQWNVHVITNHPAIPFVITRQQSITNSAIRHHKLTVNNLSLQTNSAICHHKLSL